MKFRRRLNFEENLPRLNRAFQNGFSADTAEARRAITSCGERCFAVVGSGASFSAAVFIATVLENVFRVPARAKTPNMFRETAILDEGVILVSASGKNPDILSALQAAIRASARPLIIVTSSDENPLMREARFYPGLSSITIPAVNLGEREGFFGVQSLIGVIGAFFAMAPRIREQIRVGGADWCQKICLSAEQFIERNADTIESVANSRHIIAVGSRWAYPCLVDFESKCVEGGLGWIEACEAKNFTHGRFVNSLRRDEETALIYFTTSENTTLLRMFRKSLGSFLQVLPVVAKNSDIFGAVELFVVMFYLFREIARHRGVDVSNPAVPNEARRLFHYSTHDVGRRIEARIRRKIEGTLKLKRSLNTDALSRETEEVEREVPECVVAGSLTRLYMTDFCGLALDFDGTLLPLLSPDDRIFEGLIAPIRMLLKQSVPMAVITGRGKSVITAFGQHFGAFGDLIHCYLYNGAVFWRLGQPSPESVITLNHIDSIRERIERIKGLKNMVKDVEMSSFRSQVTVHLANLDKANYVKRKVEEELLDLHHVVVRTSGRSVDVFPASISKRLALDDFRKRVLAHSREDILIIGDRGDEDGNDFELLKEKTAFSVDRLSKSAHSCFPVIDAYGKAMTGPEGTAALLRNAIISRRMFRLAV